MRSHLKPDVTPLRAPLTSLRAAARHPRRSRPNPVPSPAPRRTPPATTLARDRGRRFGRMRTCVHESKACALRPARWLQSDQSSHCVWAAVQLQRHVRAAPSGGGGFFGRALRRDRCSGAGRGSTTWRASVEADMAGFWPCGWRRMTALHPLSHLQTCTDTADPLGTNCQP